MNNIKRSAREQSILMSLWATLMGQITPNMRAVFVDWDHESICLYFFFDGPISEEEKEDVQCIGSEVVSDFPDSEFDLQCSRLDYPEPITSPGRCVYKRKEG